MYIYSRHAGGAGHSAQGSKLFKEEKLYKLDKARYRILTDIKNDSDGFIIIIIIIIIVII